MRVFRSMRLVGAISGKLRTATFEGRDHLVVPVVALMEAVIHPMNAEFPEFVPVEVLARAPGGWNGRPLVTDHPVNSKGAPISANDPDVIEAMGFGCIFGAATSQQVLQTGQLQVEAWIDLGKAENNKLAQKVVARVQQGTPVEVSVGAVVVLNEGEEGEFGGRKYKGAWSEIVPDHLAMLPEGIAGACSVAMGCGTPKASTRW